MRYSFLEQIFLRKTGILIKLTKNLITIVSSLWTRYSIKKIYMQTFALMWHSHSPCLHTFTFWWIPLTPKWERNNWMPIYGFNKEIIRLFLFLSYLTNRTQRIKISSTFSDWTNIVKGIPQGSTLGPLLFNIFMILILMIYSFSQQNMKSVILLMSIAFILVAWI